MHTHTHITHPKKKNTHIINWSHPFPTSCEQINVFCLNFETKHKKKPIVFCNVTFSRTESKALWCMLLGAMSNENYNWQPVQIVCVRIYDWREMSEWNRKEKSCAYYDSSFTRLQIGDRTPNKQNHSVERIRRPWHRNSIPFIVLFYVARVSPPIFTNFGFFRRHLHYVWHFRVRISISFPGETKIVIYWCFMHLSSSHTQKKRPIYWNKLNQWSEIVAKFGENSNNKKRKMCEVVEINC